MLRHGSMDGYYAMSVHESMEGAYITVSYNPLGIVAQWQPVELLEKMHGSIASARAKYGLHRRIEDGLPEIRQTIRCGAAVSAPASESVRHHERFIAFVLKHLHRLIYKFGLDDAGRREYGYTVAFFQRLRHYKTLIAVVHGQLTNTLIPASRTRDAMLSSSSRSTLTRACSGVRRSIE